ncbi:MAG: rhodanese-like domain-containing protein [Rothia sp. (in: high G+C Gram-positive bacteria)]|nr:rhodanese-like domain-containing protein [Rothia sp. (in: high G+C Gram-positive bacteria)]
MNDDLRQVEVDQIPAGAKILDVREDNEWEAGHIAGAQHIPLGQVPERYGEIPLDEDVYIICRSGGRSLKAVAYLQNAGFDVVNVLGGMGAWLDAGQALVSETGQQARVL